MTYLCRTILLSSLLLVVVLTSSLGAIAKNTDILVRNCASSVRVEKTKSVHQCRVCTNSLTIFLVADFSVFDHRQNVSRLPFFSEQDSKCRSFPKVIYRPPIIFSLT